MAEPCRVCGEPVEPDDSTTTVYVNAGPDGEEVHAECYSDAITSRGYV